MAYDLDAVDDLLAQAEDALAEGGSSRSPATGSSDLAQRGKLIAESWSTPSGTSDTGAEAAWAVLKAKAKKEYGPWVDLKSFLSRSGDWAIAEHRVGSEGSRSVTSEVYFLPTALEQVSKICSLEFQKCKPVRCGSGGSVLKFAEDGELHEVPLDGPTERLRLLQGGRLEPVVQDAADAAWAKLEHENNGQGRNWGNTAKRQGDWAVVRRETHREDSMSLSTSLYFLPTWAPRSKPVRSSVKYEHDTCASSRGSVIAFASEKNGVIAEVHLGDDPTEYFRLLPDGRIEPVEK